jgi:hypothetical protein
MSVDASDRSALVAAAVELLVRHRGEASVDCLELDAELLVGRGCGEGARPGLTGANGLPDKPQRWLSSRTDCTNM